MSTIEDFENAPVGATATNQDGSVRVWKEAETNCLPWVYITYDEWFSNEELVERGFTLNSVAPTTAQAALDLAWELAHPVKEGQVIPVGTWMVERRGDNFAVGKNDYYDATANEWDAENRRTIDPLPEPTPDWLDAPAVIAVCNDSMDSTVFVRENETGTQWLRDTRLYRWDELIDVVPLYPKGQDS